MYAQLLAFLSWNKSTEISFLSQILFWKYSVKIFRIFWAMSCRFRKTKLHKNQLGDIFFEVTGCFEPGVKPLFHIIKYDETFGKVKVRTIEINIVSLLDIWNINLTPSFPIYDQHIHHFWSICFKVISPVKSSSNFQPLKIASLAFTNAHHFEWRFNLNFQINQNF